MIYDMLFPFQKKIVDSFKHKDSFGLFLDMGLGKTPIALGFAEANNCTKVIVITLNSKALESKDVKGSWLWWAAKSSIEYVQHTKSSKDTFSDSNSDILLMNYEGLYKRNATDKSKRKPKVALRDNIESFISSCSGHNVAIIVDESHKMKNANSIQSISIERIKKSLLLKAEKVYTYLLTGTPFTSAYIDLYNQLKMLGYQDSKTSFIDQYCVRGCLPGLLGWQQPIVGYKNVKLLFDTLHRYAITMKSEDVVSLPEQIFVNHELQESDEFRALTREKMRTKDIREMCIKRKLSTLDYTGNSYINNPFYRNLDYPESKWLATTVGNLWLRARQISIGFQGNAEDSTWFDRSRLDELKKFLETYEDNYVLFYNFTPELVELYEICDKLGYNVDVYCGEIKSTKFYEKYASQTDEEKLVNKKNIILSNFASGSTGMNWQEYNKCIIFSMPIYKDYEQGLKRIHRLGQKNTTVYHIFYQNNWLDNGMKKSLDEKCDYSSDMFSSDIARINRITSDDSE